MSSTTIRMFKWFWAWDDEKEEQWLRAMSQRGCHLRSVWFPCYYTFEAGEPCDYVYRLDYSTDRKDYQNYLQLFLDAGWTHLGEYGGWQYFRTDAPPGEAPEIYTDNDSKLSKYRRVIVMLCALVIFPVLMLTTGRAGEASGTFQNMVRFLGFLLLLLYAYALLKLLQRIAWLKRSPR